MIKKIMNMFGTNAVDLLEEDHKKVKQLFKDYEDLVKNKGSATQKHKIAMDICKELTVHAKVEEEIFYPKVRKAIGEKDMLDEAEVEHSTAKDLIRQIENGTPKDDLYDAKVIVLGEYINHHVKEEEGEMFPKVRRSDLDLKKMGEELQKRKTELMSDISADWSKKSVTEKTVKEKASTKKSSAKITAQHEKKSGMSQAKSETKTWVSAKKSEAIKSSPATK